MSTDGIRGGELLERPFNNESYAQVIDETRLQLVFFVFSFSHRFKHGGGIQTKKITKPEIALNEGWPLQESKRPASSF